MSDETNAPVAAAAKPAAPAAPAAQPALPTISVTPSVPTEYLEKLAKAEQQAAAFAAELKKRDAADAEIKQQLAALTEKTQTTEAEKKQLAADRRAEKLRYELRQAAMLEAIDPDDVVALTLGAFTVNEQGQVVSTEATPRDPAAYLKDFLAKKPHLAKPKVAPGTGASPFPAAAPQAPGARAFDLTTAEGLTAYARHLTYPAGKAPAPAAKPGA